jgi:DNA-binding NtrC family response regulator
MEQRIWNGNIRELENFVERLVILAPSGMKEITIDILPADIRKEFNKVCSDELPYPISKSLNETLSDYEEKIIRSTLNDTNWNQSKAARILRVSEQTIRYKMAKYGIIANS